MKTFIIAMIGLSVIFIAITTVMAETNLEKATFAYCPIAPSSIFLTGKTLIILEMIFPSSNTAAADIPTTNIMERRSAMKMDDMKKIGGNVG